jgi:hypothetical protein
VHGITLLCTEDVAVVAFSICVLKLSDDECSGTNGLQQQGSLL